MECSALVIQKYLACSNTCKTSKHTNNEFIEHSATDSKEHVYRINCNSFKKLEILHKEK
jgi:hypothetical protein